MNPRLSVKGSLHRPMDISSHLAIHQTHQENALNPLDDRLPTKEGLHAIAYRSLRVSMTAAKE